MIAALSRGAIGAPLVALVVTAGCASLVGLDDLTYDEQPTGGSGGAGAGGQGAAGGSPPVGGGGSGNAGGTGGAGAGGLGGIGGIGGCSSSGDEFNDPGDLDCWNEGPVQNATAVVEDGVLKVTATSTQGWYDTTQSWFLYRNISGNFAVEIQVAVSGIADPLNPPVETFNAAGLMARDGAEAQENWFLYDVGRQSTAWGLGTVYKNTANDFSNVQFGGTSPMSGRLRLCRLGHQFYMFRNFDGGWTQDAGPLTNDQINQPELQVGIIVSSWIDGPPDVYAEFEYVRFARTPPTSMADCTAAF